MRETALKGQHAGGMPPLGYDLDTETKKLVLNEKEAEAVKLKKHMIKINIICFFAQYGLVEAF
jgi:site-specific DNA recombinase